MNRLKKIIHESGLWYFPEFAPFGPGTPKQPRPAPTPKPKAASAPNIHEVANRVFRIEDKPTQNADTEWTGLGVKKSKLTIPTLTQKEIAAIAKSQRNVDRKNRFQLEPYKRIKGATQDGHTIKGSSVLLTELYGVGYSESTIKRYRKFINQVNHSPTAKKGEGVANDS